MTTDTQELTSLEMEARLTVQRQHRAMRLLPAAVDVIADPAAYFDNHGNYNVTDWDPAAVLLTEAGARRLMGATGAERIAAERQRQLDVEGWTLEHDDEHDDGELVQAAIAYAFVGAGADPQVARFDFPRGWHSDWWKPSDDPIRNLVVAGALIAAEIDRLERKGGVS
jgi:PAS domain-containing protein